MSKIDPETGTYNPFPTYPFTGPLRPLYPLSPTRSLPTSIKRPDYSEDGNPRSEQKIFGRNNIQILDQAGIDGMRKAGRLGREVLDLAARAVRPGVTTDYIDEIVHKACIERDVCPNRTTPPPPSFTNISPVLPLPTKLRPLPQIRLHVRERSNLPRNPRSTPPGRRRHPQYRRDRLPRRLPRRPERDLLRRRQGPCGP